MRRLFGRRRKEDDYDLEQLESYLQSTLITVEPRPAFVQGLKLRLLEAPLDEPLAGGTFSYALLAMAGIVSGVVILATSIRATVTILGAFGLIRSMRSDTA